MAFTVDIRGNATHLEKTLRSVKGSIASLGGVATASVGSLAALGAAGAAGLTAFVVSSSNAAASLEDLSIQFEVLTGSASKAKELIKQFREEEKKSALSTQDYGEGAKKLLANNVAYEKIIPTLKMLADVSLGNSERFDRLSLAFGQIAAKGKLAGQELNQLAESGFNPLQQIAEKTGQTYESLFKKMEAREITIEDVTNALRDATSEGGRFYKAIEKGSAGTSAKLNQTKAAVTQLQVAFGTGFNEGLKDALDATNNFLPQLEGKFTEAGSFMGSALTDAVSGDLNKFAIMGELIGSAIGAGVTIGFKKIVMGSIEGIMVDYVDYFQSNQYRANMEQRKKFIDMAESESDPSKRQIWINAANKISMQTPQFKEQYELGRDYQSKSTGAEFMQAMQPALNKLNIAQEIQDGLRKGELTEGMRKEVREGILEAWAKNPSAGAARFSN
jgi:tape measure domain-containing protein